MAFAVESEAVDNGFIFCQAKHAGLRVSDLGLWGHTTNLHKAKTEVKHSRNGLGLLVKTSGKPERSCAKVRQKVMRE